MHGHLHLGLQEQYGPQIRQSCQNIFYGPALVAHITVMDQKDNTYWAFFKANYPPDDNIEWGTRQW